MSFTLAVCAEMVFTDLPFVERVERIHERASPSRSGTGPSKDLDALAATGAPLHLDDRVRRGRPDRPRRRRHACCATAEQSVAASRALGRPNLNLHGTGLDGDGLPVEPVEVVTGEMWLAAPTTLARIAGARRARRRRVHPREPQPRRRPPRYAVRARGRHPGAGQRRRQPAPADEPRPLPRPDRRGEPDRADPRRPALGRRDPGRRRTRAAASPGTGEINYPAMAPGARRRRLRRRRGPGGVGVAATATRRSPPSGRRLDR